MNLTEHFTLAELISSTYAQRHGIANVPIDAQITGNLYLLARGLERVRRVLGRPIVVTSGYRCPEVNAALGGAPQSAHLHGLAADFRVSGMTPREVCQIIEQHADMVGFDKLIFEGTWTHIAFPDGASDPAGEVLTAHFSAGKTASYTRGIA